MYLFISILYFRIFPSLWIYSSDSISCLLLILCIHQFTWRRYSVNQCMCIQVYIWPNVCWERQNCWVLSALFPRSVYRSQAADMKEWGSEGDRCKERDRKQKKKTISTKQFFISDLQLIDRISYERLTACHP